MSLCVKNFNSI